jgi:hypothetical protein
MLKELMVHDSEPELSSAVKMKASSERMASFY